MKHTFHFSNIYDVECVTPSGGTRWHEKVPNIVVNAGLNHALSIITATAHVTNWFVGLAASGFGINATDSATTHTFTIATPYSEAVAQTYTPGAIAAQSVDNSTTVASFSINAATTLGGAYLTNSNVKGEPSAGAILFGGAAFSAERNVQSGDTVNVTITIGAEVT